MNNESKYYGLRALVGAGSLVDEKEEVTQIIAADRQYRQSNFGLQIRRVANGFIIMGLPGPEMVASTIEEVHALVNASLDKWLEMQEQEIDRLGGFSAEHN